MKTPKQITEWLKGQKLYDKFVANYNRGVQHKMSVDVYLKRTSLANLFTGQLVYLCVRVA